MSEYKGIKGFQVQTRTDDPSPTEAQIGDFYYNSSSGQFKTINSGGAPLGSWASGGNLNTARYGGVASGNASLSIAVGGSAADYTTVVEQYDGSSWTEITDINSARGFFGSSNSSPYTASVVFGGYTGTADSSNTEVWNGSTWTEVNNFNTIRRYNGGFGALSTNALCCGGKTPAPYPSPVHSAVESWNGTSWTEVAEFSTGRNEMPVGAGTNTAGLLYGGQYPPGINARANTESWDGSSWTEVNDLNTARGYAGGGGSQTSALMYGGRASPSNIAKTESWNGTSWTEQNDLASARNQGMGASSTDTNSAIYSGGSTPPGNVATTEEWVAADFEIKTVTTS